MQVITPTQTRVYAKSAISNYKTIKEGAVCRFGADNNEKTPTTLTNGLYKIYKNIYNWIQKIFSTIKSFLWPARSAPSTTHFSQKQPENSQPAAPSIPAKESKDMASGMSFHSMDSQARLNNIKRLMGYAKHGQFFPQFEVQDQQFALDFTKAAFQEPDPDLGNDIITILRIPQEKLKDPHNV